MHYMWGRAEYSVNILIFLEKIFVFALKYMHMDLAAKVNIYHVPLTWID